MKSVIAFTNLDSAGGITSEASAKCIYLLGRVFYRKETYYNNTCKAFRKKNKEFLLPAMIRYIIFQCGKNGKVTIYRSYLCIMGLSMKIEKRVFLTQNNKTRYFI